MVKKAIFSFFVNLNSRTIDLSFNCIDFCSICQCIRLNSFPKSISSSSSESDVIFVTISMKNVQLQLQGDQHIQTYWMDIYGQLAWTFAFDSATQKRNERRNSNNSSFHFIFMFCNRQFGRVDVTWSLFTRFARNSFMYYSSGPLNHKNEPKNNKNMPSTGGGETIKITTRQDDKLSLSR